MKPMIALLLFGIITTGGVFILGINLHDGVVEDKTYQTSLHFDSDKAITDELKKSIQFRDIVRVGDKLIIDATVKTADTPVAVLYPTRRKDKIVFTLDNGTYSTDKQTKSGWYNLEFLYLLDNRTVPVRYSYYLN